MKNTKLSTTKAKFKDTNSSLIRINKSAKSLLDKELDYLKKNRKGSGKITASDILEKVLPLLNDSHRRQLLASTVTGEDRQRVAFENYSKRNKYTKKAEFLDLVIYGELSIDEFLPIEMRKQNGSLEITKIESA